MQILYQRVVGNEPRQFVCICMGATVNRMRQRFRCLYARDMRLLESIVFLGRYSRSFNPAGLPHPVGGLHSNAAEQGEVGQHLHSPVPIAIPGQGGVGHLAHAPHPKAAPFVGHGCTAQIVATDGNASAAEFPHFVAEGNGAEEIPAGCQTAEDQVRRGEGDLHAARFEAGGAIKAQSDPVGQVARSQQMFRGQLLVVGDARPLVIGMITGDCLELEGVVVDGPLGLWFFEKQGMEQLAHWLNKARQMQPVFFANLQIEIRAPSGGSVQAGTGERDRPVPGVQLPGQLRIAAVDLPQNFSVNGPPQCSGQGPPARCGEGEDGGEEHRRFFCGEWCSLSCLWPTLCDHIPTPGLFLVIAKVNGSFCPKESRRNLAVLAIVHFHAIRHSNVFRQ